MVECPSRETLHAFVREELAEDVHAAVAGHVQECAACQAELDRLSGTESIIPTRRFVGNAGTQVFPGLEGVVEELKRLGPRARIGDASSFHLESLPCMRPASDPQFLGMIGKYGVVKMIGRGGMGVVLHAVDTVLERTVALKTLLPDLQPNSEARERFLREARSAAALRHDHVVTIHAVEETDGVPFIVMELIEGESLADRITRVGSLPAEDVIRLGTQAALGLAAAHAKGLIHRDIKPANLLIDDETGRLKITDFGLAKVDDDVRLTLVGTVAGTPEFMAPEQAEGRPADHRSDLFSLGTVLYAAVTGESPFAATSALESLRRVREDQPAPIRELQPGVPAHLADVIERLLGKSPEGRIQSAEEVARLLLAPDAEPAGAGANGRIWPRRKVLIWTSAAGAFAVAGLGTLAFRPRAPARPAATGSDPIPMRGFRIAGRSQVHATLSAAVAAAAAGETIEVFGNETFVTEPIRIEGKPLTIRAASGQRPIVSSRTPAGSVDAPVIETDAALVLEGLDFLWFIRPRRQAWRDDGREDRRCAVFCQSGELSALNCRFQVGRSNTCIGLDDADGNLVNCIFAAEHGTGVAWRAEQGGRLRLTNSLCDARSGIVMMRGVPPAAVAPAYLEAVRCTLEGESAFRWMDTAGRQQRVRCRAERCLVGTSYLHVVAAVTQAARDRAEERGPRRVLQSRFSWSETENVYDASCRFLGYAFRLGQPTPPSESQHTLADWHRFWGLADTQSRQLHSGERPPEGIGGDPTRLGPGDAYELVRQSAEYKNWNGG